LASRAGLGGSEEDRIGIVPEAMTEDMKRAEGVTEVTGDVLGGPAVDEEGPESFIHAVFRVFGFEEESSLYLYWLSYRHNCTLSHTISCVKPYL